MQVILPNVSYKGLLRFSALAIIRLSMTLLTLALSSNVNGQATSFVPMGFRASEGGGGAISAEWTTGNLGNTWAEGEWIPYQVGNNTNR